MTYQKKDKDRQLLRHQAQPGVEFDKLFNLMHRADRYGVLFIILDECENEFDHRLIHTLDKEEQKRLYLLARDEMARYWHRNELSYFASPSEPLQ